MIPNGRAAHSRKDAMRTLIVHNPRAGFGSDAIFEFERSLLRAGDECVMRFLEDDQPVREVLTDAEDFDVVVCSGGDGSVTNMLTALAGREITTCVFPSGTANLLFANLGLAQEPAAIARACRVGATMEMDLGLITWVNGDGTQSERGFALMSGSGFDAQLMQAAIPNKRTLGQAAYFAAVLANPRPEVVDFTITIDGEAHERRGISCMVANTAMIQGEIQIIPNCRMDDGLIDVIVLETEDATQLIKPLFAGLVDKSGNQLGRPFLETFRGKEITVESAVPVPLEIDGDVVSEATTSWRVVASPASCKVVVDQMSPYYSPVTEPRFPGTDEVANPEAWEGTRQ